ncbi:MAG: glycosyltransferase [Cytophagales bacterium]|nr:glycosyltransferase [Cytophagales bacterium]
MRITYYLRDPREGNYSIEKIFKALGNRLKDKFEVSFFYIDSDKSVFKNLRSARKAQGDINHITGDVNWLIFGLDRRKTILTVHDLGHFENTLVGLKRWIYKYLWLYIPFKRAKFITAISSFTKSRINYHFGFSRKVIIIHNPLVSIAAGKYKRPFNTRKPNVLQIGSMPNKNLDQLIDAVEGLDINLLLVRKPNEEIKQLLKRKEISYEWYSELSEDQLAAIYLKTDILFFGSTYEGFGLPIIEAQSFGIPVITSNLCSMPEVAGLNSLLINPYDKYDIREALEKIRTDKDFRETLSVQGKKNVDRFRIDIISKKYQELYQKVYES